MDNVKDAGGDNGSGSAVENTTAMNSSDNSAPAAAGDIESKLKELRQDYEALREDCIATMNGILPCLEKGTEMMSSIQKRHLSEFKAMKKPPKSVMMVMEGVAVLLGYKPQIVADGDSSGGEIAVYTEQMTKTFSSSNFLDNVIHFDKENIPDSTISKLEALLEDEELIPCKIQKVSSLGYALLEWLRSVLLYAQVSRDLSPKRDCLARLATEMALLEDQLKQQKLHGADASASEENINVAEVGSSAEEGEMEQRWAAFQRKMQAVTVDIMATMRTSLDADEDLFVPSEGSIAGVDESLAAAIADFAGADKEARLDALVVLLTQWTSWGSAWPRPLQEHLSPGVGKTSEEGEEYEHPLVGDMRPLIHVVTDASEGWGEMVTEHVRCGWSRRYQRSLASVLTLAITLKGVCDAAEVERGQLSATVVRLSRKLQAYADGSEMFLRAWPRGEGPGELLLQPEPPFDTPVVERGICREWWMAVVNRAPFAPTRVFVDCFVKPVSREASCALYFFIPPKYRCKPDVFISHSWDGSIWDLRPPLDVGGVWVDTFVVNQHPVKPKTDENRGEAQVSDLYPDVGEIRNAVISIGRTHLCIPFSDDHSFIIDGSAGVGSASNAVRATKEAVADIIPFRRSWCVFEMIFTPPGKLGVFLGWNTWKKQEHFGILKALEQLKVEEAETTSLEDKTNIDGYVLERYGSFEKANSDFFRITFEAFVEHVREARRIGHLFTKCVDAGDDPSQELCLQTGGQPLFDDSILQLYEEKVRAQISTQGESEDPKHA